MADYGSIRERWTRVVTSDDSAQRGRVAAAPQLASGSEGAAAADESLSTPGEQGRSLSDGTFIGGGALFEGTLTLRGDFRIDTEFRGELETRWDDYGRGQRVRRGQHSCP